MIKLSYVIAFIAGSAIGSLVTYELTYRKFEKKATDEINHAYAEIEKRYGNYDSDKDNTEDNPEKESESVKQVIDNESVLKEYSDKVKNLNYAACFVSDEEAEDDTDMPDGEFPYIISADQFGDVDYTLVYLTYHADGALTDDMDDIIDNVDSVVGMKNLLTFEKEGTDEIFIRNDVRKCDYDITFSENNYYMDN